MKLPTLKLVMEPKIDYRSIKSITCSRDSFKYGHYFWDMDNIDVFEEFHVLFLNYRNKPIGTMKAGEGTINTTVVDVNRVCATAVLSRATAVILFHNHPSGETTPSTSDHEITNKITEALKCFDIKVLDHIILTRYSYYSFSDEGIIKQ